ncbi:nickel-dependent lactate racemase [Myxococcota bacterium]|nr:nickel-dependent lactate racemase [Myxococcota bacterium]
MARPQPRITRDANIEFIDEKSGPRFIWHGTRFKEIVLPRGTRVIHPSPPIEPLGNPKAAIRYALQHPEEMDPLFAQLRPGMKLSIAVDDISLPLPPMVLPDIREVILTEILELCGQYGVDDIHIIIATALHRRMTAAEAKRMVGSKIFNQYWPDRFYNHDAEDPDGIVELGVTDHGERVRINRRCVESDLLIYVNINLVPMDGGHKSVTIGLTDYPSLKSHHNPHVMHKCHSYMDPRPERSMLAKVTDRMGKIVDAHMKVFHIETALNSNMYAGPLAFLGKPEFQWSEFDKLKFQTTRAALDRLPEAGRRAIFEQVPSPFGLTGVFAGKTEPVHKKTLERVYAQYAVPVKGQADVLICGIPFISPYNVNSILNPILVQVMALGYLFNMYRGVPLLKKGGVLIISHPCAEDFNRDHHPSYVEFYQRILDHGTNSYDLEKFEAEFAQNPDYIQMYRKGNAYHGVHPFYMWYWGDAGRAHVGQTIIVGAENERAPKRMGWRTARDFESAIDKAKDFLGKSSPDITYLHIPPILVTDVEP